MRVGYELPNRPDGAITPEEWQRWDALGGTVAKVRPYNCTPATLDYLAASKVETVILRPSADGDIDVGARVNDLQPAIVQLLQWDFTEIIVLPDSEPNLGNRPCPPDYWNRVSQVIVHPAMKDFWGAKLKLASPPMAVAQGEVDWYAAAGDLMTGWDYLSGHLYGQLSPDLVNYTLSLLTPFGVPIIADEVGDSHPTASEELKATSVASYLRIAADAGVELATLFNMGGSDDWRTFWFSPDVIRRCIRPVVEMVNAPA